MGEIFLLLGLLCLFSCRVFFRREWNTDYLSIDQTQVIKGIFICIVFFSHINAYVTYTSFRDEMVRKFTELLGQTMVAPFLFYSGYGVMESIRKKGRAYVADIPRKRILATWFQYACAVLLFVAVALWKGSDYSAQRYLLSFVAWENIENSNWYIFDIMLLYAITWLSFTVCRKEERAVGLCLLLTVLWIFCLSFWQIKGVFWCDTLLCYVLGMVYSRYKERIHGFLGEKRLLYWLILGVLLAAVLDMKRYEYEVVGSSIRSCLFALLVVLATMRIRVKNRFLHWCGTHLFALYILQRLPMVVLKELGVADRSVFLFGVVCIAVTLLLTIPFTQITDRIWNKLSGQP